MANQNESRIAVVSAVWFGAVILLAALFIAAGLQGAFTIIHFALVGLILTLAFIGTPAAMYLTRYDEQDIVKAKRQHIDAILRDMSDDELLELKQRLSDGDYSEESLLEYVSDDGELVFRA